MRSLKIKRGFSFTILSLLNIFFVCKIYSQTLTVSSPQLNFGNAYENAPDSLQLTINNNMGHAVNVTGIKFYNTYGSPAFSAALNVFNIADGSSATVWIKFSPQHNIFHNSELVIENDGLRGYISVDLIGQGKYSNTYYNATENLAEENLKTTLRTITGNNYISLLYSPARDTMFMVIDNKRVNGQGAAQNTIEGVYTGIEAVGYIDRADCQTNFSFNTEHTFPQSLFSSLEPMKSDLHQIFATDDMANTVRGDNPFGVVTNPTWSQGGSLSNSTTFEPRDEHKGAAARAMFYFVLRYQNYNNFLSSQESILRTWNKNFLPSQIEKRRNDDIYFVQQNRNPFTDYPQFADRITSISNFSVAPVLPSLDLTQDTIIYGYVQQSVSNIFHYVIVNNGNVNVQLSNFNLSNPGILSFQSGGNNTTLAPGEALGLDINLFTTNSNAINGALTFNTDVPGQSLVTIPIYANDPVFTSVPETISESITVFPNPAQDVVTINFGNENLSVYKISFNDILGNQLKVFTHHANQQSLTIDLKELRAGIYFLRFQEEGSGNFFYHQLMKF